jgi:hypothetical protein
MFFFKDIQFHDWEKIGKYKTRRLEYTMDGVVGSKFCKTFEIEVKKKKKKVCKCFNF